MDDEQLDRRLHDARHVVRLQQARLRELRRRLRTAHAQASAIRESAVVVLFQARGQHVRPPVPSHVPDDLA